MSRFSRQAQRIESDWLRSLREAAKERRPLSTALLSTDTAPAGLQAVIDAKRRVGSRFSRPPVRRIVEDRD